MIKIKESKLHLVAFNRNQRIALHMSFHIAFHTFHCTYHTHRTHVTHVAQFAFHEQRAFHVLHHTLHHFMCHFMSFCHENS